MLEQPINSTVFPQFLERGAVLWDTEHSWHSSCELDLNRRCLGICRIVQALTLPMVKCKPHDLLRRTSALDYTRRVGEEGESLLVFLDLVESLVAVIVAVYGRDRSIGVGQRLRETMDAVGVDVDARNHHEMVICYDIVVGECNRVFKRCEGLNTLLVVLNLAID